MGIWSIGSSKNLTYDDIDSMMVYLFRPKQSMTYKLKLKPSKVHLSLVNLGEFNISKIYKNKTKKIGGFTEYLCKVKRVIREDE